MYRELLLRCQVSQTAPLLDHAPLTSFVDCFHKPSEKAKFNDLIGTNLSKRTQIQQGMGSNA